MRHKRHIAIAFGCLLILTACGQPQEVEQATRAARTAAIPTQAIQPRGIIQTEADAICVARTVVSPYLASWQDVIAIEEYGIWRVEFRGYYPSSTRDTQSGDSDSAPISIFIDAKTGMVVRKGYV